MHIDDDVAVCCENESDLESEHINNDEDDDESTDTLPDKPPAAEKVLESFEVLKNFVACTDVSSQFVEYLEFLNFEYSQLNRKEPKKLQQANIFNYLK